VKVEELAPGLWRWSAGERWVRATMLRA